MQENRTVKEHRMTALTASSGFAAETRTTGRLAVPIIAGNFLQNAMSLVDTLMVGQVSVTAVAAASLASALFMVPLVFGFGVLGPFSVFVAGAVARGESEEAARYLRRGLVLAGAFGVALALVITGISRRLDFLHQSTAVLVQARPFLLLLSWSVVPMYLFQILKQYGEALHAAWAPMLILTGGVLINVALNWIFIFGHLGAPALGLIGAGWATLIARLVSLLVLGVVIFRTHFRTSVLRKAMFSPGGPRQGYRELLSLGLPAGCQVILDVGAFTFAAIMMGWISEAALAAHQIALSVASFTFMFPLGLANAGAIRVSHAIHSGDPVRAKWCALGSLLMALGFMSLTAVIICFFARPLAGLFVHDSRVIALAARLLIIAGLFQIFDGTQIICAGALRGFHDVRVPTLLNFAVYWLVALPISYLLAFHFRWGAVGVWWGLLVGLVSISVLLAARLRAKFRALLRCHLQSRHGDLA